MSEEMRELTELRSQSPETRVSKHDNRGMCNKVNSREFVLLHNRAVCYLLWFQHGNDLPFKRLLSIVVKIQLSETYEINLLF